MTIIVVSDYGSVNGGAAQVAISSLNALANAGHQVIFLSSVPPVDSGIDTERVRVVNFGYADLLNDRHKLNAAIRGIWDFNCARYFRAILSECRVEETVIHFHTWVKSLSSSVIWESLRLGFKVVVTLHDYFSVCPNGALYNYNTGQHCLKKPMSLDCAITNCDSRSYTQKNWRYIRHVVQAHCARVPERIKFFITISDYSEKILRKFIGDGSRFYRVRNPVDIPEYPIPNVSGRSTFIFVGRLSPEKGGDIFALAARSAGVESVFVGDGSEAPKISELNPKAKVVGWQDRERVISYIRSSIATVFPSLWHETQGLVVNESAALGIPAIVSDDCAAIENIQDGYDGLLFRRGDVQDLARKLLLLKNNPYLAHKIGKAAYVKHWANPPTLAKHVEDLLRCYNKILE